MEVKQNKLPKSQIELEFELSADEFKAHIEHALEHLKKHVKVDGFRPGQAPAKLVEDKIKPESLLMEAGDCAVQESYEKYIKESKLEPIGHPEVSIIKIAQGSPFIFKAVVTLLPEVELPNYKDLAKTVKGKDVSVSEEEIQDALNYLQKSRAKFTAKNEAAEKKDFVEIEYSNSELNGGKEIKDQFVLGEAGFMKGFEDNLAGMKAGEEKTFKATFPQDSPQKNLAGKEAEFKVRMISVQKMEVPEADDGFAKQLGPFDTLVALKTSMKEGLIAEKKDQEKQRVRAEILNKIAEKSKIEIPDSMVNSEQERLLNNLKNRISGSANLSFEQYLASIKKTEEEIKETYKKEAEKRIRGFLVLRELGKLENIQVSDQEVEEEAAKAVKNYSKEQLDKIDINELKEYTKGVIYNEKVFQQLEKLSQN